MNLHIPTLLSALIAGYLMLTLQLAFARPVLREQPGVRRWVWGSWAMLLGFALLAGREVLPSLLSVAGGNALIALGLMVYQQALHEHLNAPLPRWPVGLWAASLVVMAMALQWAPAVRTAVFSAVFLLLLLPMVRLLLKSGWRAERSLQLVTITMLAVGLVLAFRIVDSLWNPEDYRHVLQSSTGQGLTFLMALMALWGVGFGFVLAVFERVAVRMEQMASHDGLTGCLNRSTTDALLMHALARSRREGSSLAFVLLDLDHFKQINDRHGHGVGDAVLREFARVARQRLRAADVLGRTGGEEFGMILPGTDANGARRLVEEVRLATEALEVRDEAGQRVSVSVSAGVAVSSADDGVSADRLYGRADQALYEAKHAGRNRVELFGDAGRRQAPLPMGED